MGRASRIIHVTAVHARAQQHTLGGCTLSGYARGAPLNVAVPAPAVRHVAGMIGRAMDPSLESSVHGARLG